MIIYILKSTLSLLIFFGLYWFLLRKEKRFVFNRFFLITSVMFSLLLPLISIPVSTGSSVPFNLDFHQSVATLSDSGPLRLISPGGNLNSSQAEIDLVPGFNFTRLWLIIYFSGVFLFLVRFMVNIYFLIVKQKLSEKIEREEYRFVLVDDKSGPYCFFRSIFIDRGEFLSGVADKDLIAHELEHVRQAHTLDVMILEVIKVLYWFNPLLYLYDRAIRINHEYLADEGVLKRNNNPECYIKKLLSHVATRNSMSFVSGSGNSFTRKRLMMIRNAASGKKSGIARIILTLSLSFLTFMMLGFRESINSGPIYDLTSSQIRNVYQNGFKGIVLTEKGVPLIGASIVYSGKDSEVLSQMTDFDGRFLINDLKPGSTILVKNHGFKDQVLIPDPSPELTIIMVRDPDFEGRVFIPLVKVVYFRNRDFSPANALIMVDGRKIGIRDKLDFYPNDLNAFNILNAKETEQKYGKIYQNGTFEISLSTTNSGKNIDLKNEKLHFQSISVNNEEYKDQRISVPVSELCSAMLWRYFDIDNNEIIGTGSLRIMTRDYYKVGGIVVDKSGKALSGVKISASDNAASVISDKKGRFILKDVRENGIVEFSASGFISYYLSTSFDVPYNEELVIEMEKEGSERDRDAHTGTLEKPNYPGGNEQLRRYVSSNVRYPQSAYQQKVKGTIFVSFIVDTAGKVKDIKLLNKLHPSIDTEVLRVIGSINNFKPGSLNGIPVDMSYSLYLSFSY